MMRLKWIFSLVICLMFLQKAQAQTHWFIWSHHDPDVERINGISLGLGNFIYKYADVNGIKIDIPGLGIFVPIGMGEDPFRPAGQTDSASMAKYIVFKDSINSKKSSEEAFKTNGIYLSLTGDSEYTVNGLCIHPIGGVTGISNGINLAGIMGFTAIMNGLQVTLLFQSSGEVNGVSIAMSNSTVNLSGLQIGLFNSSLSTKGFQIGLWNKNEKRTLPLINWNF